ncbi:Hypothetical predicted protein, partial [Paramuricea clavata]
MAYGYPVIEKSTAVDAAMATIGQRNNIGGPFNEELDQLSGPSSNEKSSTLLLSGPFNEALHQLSGPSSSEKSSMLPFS